MGVSLNRKINGDHEQPGLARGAIRFPLSKEYYELKAKIHDRLLELIDLSLLNTVNEAQLRQEIRRLV